jgi:mxaJ protein
MTAALRDDAIDVAVLWGAQAGYFARRGTPELAVTPIAAKKGVTSTFDIAMGVRRDDRELGDEVAQALVELKPRIEAVLDSYGVARVTR